MSEKLSVDRRDFLKSAAVTGAAALVPGAVTGQSGQAGQQAGRGGPSGPPAQASAPVAPREVDPSDGGEVITTDRPGGDFMFIEAVFNGFNGQK